MTAAPQKFKVDILPVDDGTPRIVTNLGLQWLEYMEDKVKVFLLLFYLLVVGGNTLLLLGGDG